jgi:ubiquinone/menaquinone biosynthesis C-methylase UbiE
VIGVDFEPALLEIGERRPHDAGLDITWAEADLAALAVADGWADVVLSVLGVIYAADHAAAARELIRTVTPGGRIVRSGQPAAGDGEHLVPLPPGAPTCEWATKRLGAG